MRRLGLLCVALLLASCAHSPPQLALPNSVKTIAVIPDIPSSLTLMTTGMTVFEDDVDHVPVAEWHLDTVAVDAVSEALSPRYRIVKGSTDRSFETSDSPKYRSQSSHRFTPLEFGFFAACCLGGRLPMLPGVLPVVAPWPLAKPLQATSLTHQG